MNDQRKLHLAELRILELEAQVRELRASLDDLRHPAVIVDGETGRVLVQEGA